MGMIVARIVMSLCLSIPFFSITAQAAEIPPECVNAGITPVALVVGEQGQVAPGDSNNVRDTPSRSGTQVGAIPAGGVFAVLDGPVCADGLSWWQVDYQGLTGWTVDGAEGEAWLLPVNPNIVPATPLEMLHLASNVITAENASHLVPIRVITCPDIYSGYLFTLSPDQRFITKSCTELGIFSLEDGALSTFMSSEAGDPQALRFLPDSSLLWVDNDGSRNPHYFRSTYNGTGWDTQSLNAEEALALAFSPGLLNSPSARRINALIVTDPVLAGLLPDRYGAFALNADQTQVAIISPNYDDNDSLLQVADLSTSEILMQHSLDIAPMNIEVGGPNILFSPSGNFVLGEVCLTMSGMGFACEGDRTAIIWWAADSGQEVARWTLPAGNYTSTPAFSPDGDLLAVPTMNSTVIYSVDTGEPIFTLPGHAGQVGFSPDGMLLIVGGQDETTVYAVP